MSSPAVLGNLGKVKSQMTVFQANLILAIMAGFWARKSDGHPGPDLVGRGLMILHIIVSWERMKKHCSPKRRVAKEPRGKPG